MRTSRCFMCMEVVALDTCEGYRCNQCGYNPGWDQAAKGSSPIKEYNHGKLEKLRTKEVVLRPTEKKSLGEKVV